MTMASISAHIHFRNYLFMQVFVLISMLILNCCEQNWHLKKGKTKYCVVWLYNTSKWPCLHAKCVVCERKKVKLCVCMCVYVSTRSNSNNLITAIVVLPLCTPAFIEELAKMSWQCVENETSTWRIVHDFRIIILFGF